MKKTMITLLMACSLFTISCDQNDDVTLQNPTDASGIPNKEQSAAISFYRLNEATSVAEWKGAGPGAAHTGSFTVEAQNIEVVKGKIKAGSFVIPIASIQNFDLPDHIKHVLLDHLKSADFFNMALYPEARFVIRKVTSLPHPAEEAIAGANSRVSGDFTMLGQTHPISFPARIAFTGERLEVEAVFSIDRTQWGMTYAADPSLGEHHIYPTVEIHLKVFGQKQ